VWFILVHHGYNFWKDLKKKNNKSPYEISTKISFRKKALKMRQKYLLFPLSCGTLRFYKMKRSLEKPDACICIRVQSCRSKIGRGVVVFLSMQQKSMISFAFRASVSRRSIYLRRRARCRRGLKETPPPTTKLPHFVQQFPLSVTHGCGMCR